MPDRPALEAARGLIVVQQADAMSALRRTIGQRFARLAASGASHSSGAIFTIAEVCVGAVGAAAPAAWSELWRAMVTARVTPSPELADELKNAVRELVSPHVRRIMGTFDEYRGRIDKMISSAAARQSIDQADRLALRQVDAEIDLAVMSLNRVAREGQQGVVQVYGPVGAIVSGMYANASVVQNLGPQDHTELRAALTELRRAVESVEDQRRRQELADLTDEVRDELEKPAPNSLRVGAALMAIATGVQTIATVGPAYQAVKAAAALVGIQLP